MHAHQCRCYTAFKPFVGDALARVYAAHALCTQAVDAPPDMATSKAPGKDALTQARLVPVRELQKVRKNRASRFSKRRKNFIKKAHELYEDCEVDVFLCVRSRRNNQMWQYSSGFTPPSQTEMVRLPRTKAKTRLVSNHHRPIYIQSQ